MTFTDAVRAHFGGALTLASDFDRVAVPREKSVPLRRRRHHDGWQCGGLASSRDYADGFFTLPIVCIFPRWRSMLRC